MLAVILAERGADQVVRHFADSEIAISAVNLAEVVSRLAEAGEPEPEIRARLDPFGLQVVPFNEELAYDAGLLRPVTRSLALSLADRACLALARRLSVPALTADRAWARLSVGVEIQVIR